MDVLKPVGKEEIIYRGEFFEIVKQPMKTGDKIVNFEIARRSPGVRLIIIKNNKMLLIREFRTEIDDFDWRLSGGRVFDTLKQYREALETKQNIMECAVNAAKKECLEETGLIVNSIKHFQTTKAGARVIWDLFYYIVDDFTESSEGPKLELGEVIHPEWKTFDEVKDLCLNNKIKEDRTVGVLLRFLLKHA